MYRDFEGIFSGDNYGIKHFIKENQIAGLMLSNRLLKKYFAVFASEAKQSRS
jgi:hypothetical protein